MRRKNDPFSPQARWGDDGARRVVKHVTAPLWHACSPIVARQIPELLAASWVPTTQPPEPRVYWSARALRFAVTPCKCYVELGFFMLLKGKLSSIPADFF